jgi:hypothetical protein
MVESDIHTEPAQKGVKSVCCQIKPRNGPSAWVWLHRMPRRHDPSLNRTSTIDPIPPVLAHTDTHTHTHTRAQQNTTHTLTHTLSHTHSHRHTLTHTHTQTHTHTHIHLKPHLREAGGGREERKRENAQEARHSMTWLRMTPTPSSSRQLACLSHNHTDCTSREMLPMPCRPCVALPSLALHVSPG